MHTPVFLNETIEGLSVKPGGLYIDGTYGEGGHSSAIAAQGGRVLAIDLDGAQVDKRRRENDREIGGVGGEDIQVVQGNYADIAEIAKKNDFYPIDGVLLDFGLSMEQIAKSGRGFSYKNLNEPLDMRIDSSSSTQTAADIINSSNRQQLYEIFTRNSEEISAQPISNALKSASRIRTVGDVIRALEGLREGGVRGVGKGVNESELRRVFQALRIEVNNEFENIKQGIEGAYEITKPGGRIAIISFHSPEDRIVKLWSKSKGLKEINKVNNGERSFEKSAVLRVFEK